MQENAILQVLSKHLWLKEIPGFLGGLIDPCLQIGLTKRDSRLDIDELN